VVRLSLLSLDASEEQNSKEGKQEKVPESSVTFSKRKKGKKTWGAVREYAKGIEWAGFLFKRTDSKIGKRVLKPVGEKRQRSRLKERLFAKERRSAEEDS